MNSSHRKFRELIELGHIPKEKIGLARSLVDISPHGKSWQTFIDQLLLWIGSLALAFSVVFFIAYNWNDLGQFSKFAMVEGIMVLSVVAYCKFTEGSISSKVSLFVATVSLGVLLALFGQTYQTGADPWQLFFNWALLMLPWAIIGRFSALWVAWVALINVSIVLYYQTFSGVFGLAFSSTSAVLWGTFLFNTLAFIAWQFLATIWKWLADEWAVRLLAVGSGVPLNWLALTSILDNPSFILDFPFLAWLLWLCAMFYVYRKIRLDMFMLAGCCLSLIIITVTLFGRHILDLGNAGALLFLAFMVIGMGAGAALWLKRVQHGGQA